MVSKPSTQTLALACGTTGAYVDVTDDLVTDSVKGAWGRTNGFSDTRPGVFSFDLVNDTGKYTPGNTASSLATTVRVGMGAHHIIDGMHFAGTIRSTQPYFDGPDGLSGSSKLQVTCDDMLGNAARNELRDLGSSLFVAAGGFASWPLDDAAGSAIVASEQENTGGLIAQGATLGVSTAIPTGTVAALPTTAYLSSSVSPFPDYPYTAYPGAWNFWVMQNSGGSFNLNAVIEFAPLVSRNFNVLVSGGNIIAQVTPGGASVTGPAIVDDVPYFVSIASTAALVAGFYEFTIELRVNGVSYGTSATTGSTITTLVPHYRNLLFNNRFFTGTVYVGQITHTNTALNGTLTQATTEAGHIEAIAATTPEITIDTLPTLSSSPLSTPDIDGTSALDALNAVVRTEQGYLWAETTGTLTAPVQKIKVRARERGATVDAAHTFSVSEIQNAPEFVTDIENMVSSTTARGPVADVTITDPTLTPYVGSASDSTTVLLRDPIDLASWAEDRMLRGKASGVRLPQITIDALRINRWTDVSALRPGDRVRITGIPSAVFGVSYIDGWLIGGAYALRYPSLHSEDALLFTFYFQPVLAATAIYDTNRYMAGGDLSLSAGINSSVTSISVATTGATFTTAGGDLPLNIIIDSEEMTVTAASSATPQVFTVTRGQNGTTAKSHSAAALVELAAESLYAF